MWRRLFRRVHPDAGGDSDLFVWSRALYEHVAGTSIPEDPPRRDPPKHKKTSSADRVDYSGAERFDSFEELTRHAVAMADEEPTVYGDLLVLLRDCYPSVPTDHVLRRSEWQGATFKQLAYIGHLANMSSADRSGWYAVAKAIPLSQHHAGARRGTPTSESGGRYESHHSRRYGTAVEPALRGRGTPQVGSAKRSMGYS
jgi:hypothetical protein